MAHQPRHVSALTVLAALALAAGVVAAGCQKRAEATTSTEPSTEGSSQPAAAQEPVSPPKAATAQEPVSPPKAATAQEPVAQSAPAYHEANFDLEMTPKGPYKSGQAGEVQVVLVAKGSFHVNDKYPIKLKLRPVDGIKYPAPVVTKDQVTLEHKRAVMKVALTPEGSGKKQIEGEFAFSICTDDVCLMEKRGLAQAIDVN